MNKLRPHYKTKPYESECCLTGEMCPSFSYFLCLEHDDFWVEALELSRKYLQLTLHTCI